jgi:cation-transporting ATPase E
VLTVVLVALAPWFAALTAAYRFRLLDRLLGLQELPRAGP